ncbi:hypothetical protein ACFL1H_08060, partial [Nanoarchaeota archaeon]
IDNFKKDKKVVVIEEKPKPIQEISKPEVKPEIKIVYQPSTLQKIAFIGLSLITATLGSLYVHDNYIDTDPLPSNYIQSRNINIPEKHLNQATFCDFPEKFIIEKTKNDYCVKPAVSVCLNCYGPQEKKCNDAYFDVCGE